MLFAMAINRGGHCIIVCDEKGAVLVEDKPGKHTREIDKSLNPYAASSHEGSMSRVIHSITFDPTEVVIPSTPDELKKYLIVGDDGKMSVIQLRNLSGRYLGYKVKPEMVDYLMKSIIPSKARALVPTGELRRLS